MILFLIAFFTSLLIFSAIMPQFGLYLAILCSAEWICILSYRRKDNCQFFLRAFVIGLGNSLAFTIQWFLMGRNVSLSNIDVLESILLLLLFAGALYVVFIITCNIVKRVKERTKAPQDAGEETGSSYLLPERKHDLQRLEGFLQGSTQLIGVDALWGDGKTFLINQLCAQSQIHNRYEIVRINALAGNEDEIELTLMNEFDRILRRNRIFSLASKQMLKLLENNDILKQLQWLLIEDTQSVSTTFSLVLGDLEKLNKNVLIIVDDIERLGDNTLIRKLFALMESVSSPKVQIIYLFNSSMLTGFDRSYLEKYIPCYMKLTPVRFASIVQALWGELQMDITGIACKDVEGLVDFPKSSFSITNILALDWTGGMRPFHLDNITVRRVRVFLEEFRDLIRMRSGADGKAAPTFSDTERELFLKCIFIKHFLHDSFEKFTIGIRVADSCLFQLSEEAKTILSEFGLQAPDSVTLLYLLGIRRQLHCAEDMRNFMQAVLSDDRNYNCLIALSMLDFDYTDIWQEIQKAERPGVKQTPAAAAAYGNRRLDPYIMRAEQIGNEDISNINRERNNERIDRVMWNLLANGSSELADLDAYVRHFQEIVLTAAPVFQKDAWDKFLSDAYHSRIYKNNVTRNRIGVDSYLPLFQGFHVTNAAPEQWIKLLDFYFRLNSENANNISVEMIQNLNYVDMTDCRVYMTVLKRFTQCGIIGNLNSEPCMYRFLKQVLRLSFSLGYTKASLFHDVWYMIDEPQDTDSLPSKQYEAAVMTLAEKLDTMKHRLEQDKLADPALSWFNSDINVIIGFIGKCEELIAKEKAIQMRTLRINTKESSRSRHQELCDTFQQKLQSGSDTDMAEWFKQVRSAYESGKLDPLEIRELVKRMADNKPPSV